MKYFYIGIVLLIAFWLQDAFGLKWQWLEQAQSNEIYKQCSGFLLMFYLFHQWLISLLRLHGKIQSAWSNYPWHLWFGALAPLVFYFHSTQFGYAYQFWLSMVYFGTIVIGLLNHETLSIKKMRFYNSWITAHVSSSLFVIVLMGYHIYVVYMYE